MSRRRRKRQTAPPRMAKAPRRADSRQIVEAILQAASEAARDGVSHLSTSAIARRAGVGIGSLYRYFPNKEAIATELSRAQHRRFTSALERALAEPGLTLEEAVRGCVRVLVVADEEDRRLRKALLLALPAEAPPEERRGDGALPVLELPAEERRSLATVPG